MRTNQPTSLYGLTIEGEPQVCKRTRQTRDGKRINDRKYRGWMMAWAPFAKLHRKGAKPIVGPVVLEVVAIFRRPQRYTNARTGKARKPPVNGRWPKGTRPDLDNVVKAVKDLLDKADVYHDDGQVVEIVARKAYAGSGETPHTDVRLYRPVIEADLEGELW